MLVPIRIPRFEGGKVFERWGFYGQLSMLRQLGLALAED